jgi:hypothetical protein
VRGGAEAARLAHNQEVGGSSPPPATNTKRFMVNDDGLTRLAYGLLWLYSGTDTRIYEARRLLLEAIGPDKQKRAIQEAKAVALKQKR